MAAPRPLSPALREFIESMGVYFERYGLARIGGRILGLLMVADRPLSLDDMANTLRVSRASVSTNMRLITASSLADHVSLPGDRRDYYQFGRDTWEHALKAEVEAIILLRRIAERGLAAVSVTENTAREHLEEALEFCDLLVDDRQHNIERWQALQEAKGAGSADLPEDTDVYEQA